MAYNKNIWTSGDVITAEKMNNIEDGIDGLHLYYHVLTIKNSESGGRYFHTPITVSWYSSSDVAVSSQDRFENVLETHQYLPVTYAYSTGGSIDSESSSSLVTAVYWDNGITLCLIDMYDAKISILPSYYWYDEDQQGLQGMLFTDRVIQIF